MIEVRMSVNAALWLAFVVGLAWGTIIGGMLAIAGASS